MPEEGTCEAALERNKVHSFFQGWRPVCSCKDHIMINPMYTGTMDPVVSKMLNMHAPSLSPGAFLELELSPMVQSAALLGLGLLFRGSCHRYRRSS